MKLTNIVFIICICMVFRKSIKISALFSRCFPNRQRRTSGAVKTRVIASIEASPPGGALPIESVLCSSPLETSRSIVDNYVGALEDVGGEKDPSEFIFLICFSFSSLSFFALRLRSFLFPEVS